MATKTTKPTDTPDPAEAAPEAPAAIPGLGVGRLIHYVLAGGEGHGECRAAIIVRVSDAAAGTVNLAVLTDGDQDGRVPLGQLWWRPAVAYSETPQPNTWHWPERV